MTNPYTTQITVNVVGGIRRQLTLWKKVTARQIKAVYDLDHRWLTRINGRDSKLNDDVPLKSGDVVTLYTKSFSD